MITLLPWHSLEVFNQSPDLACETGQRIEMHDSFAYTDKIIGPFTHMGKEELAKSKAAYRGL
jgi:hypothetical protein